MPCVVPTSTVTVISTIVMTVTVTMVALAVFSGLEIVELPGIPFEVTMLPPLVFGPPLVELVVGVRTVMAVIPLDR